MIYINKRTGAKVETNCVLKGEWIPKEAKKIAPVEEAPKKATKKKKA